MLAARKRVLMVHYGPYLRPLGGGTKADRYILEHLAGLGFDCTAVIPASHSRYISRSTVADHDSVLAEPQRQSVKGVDVHVVYEDSPAGYRRHEGLLRHLKLLIGLSPDWIFVTGSDRGHRVLKHVVCQTGGGNVIYIVRATAELPMGPRAIVEDPLAVEAMGRVHRILCASRYMASYIQTWSGLDATPLDVPVYGREPFPHFGEGAHITIINPCAIKGIDIFLALAKRHPQWSFAAVPTWGTTSGELIRLRGHDNIVELKASPDIDDILRQTRVLLVPSVWDEAFGMVVIEAMLRGIPVLASDIGGLPEAKLGVPYLLPVRPIETYRGHDRVTRTPLAEVPKQDIEPWSRALTRLYDVPGHYVSLSRASRQAAVNYVAALNMSTVAEMLVNPATQGPPQASPTSAAPWARLNDAQRAALLSRLREKRAAP